MNVLLSVLLVLSVITDCYCETKDDGVTVLTVASNLTEGYQRYLRSANVFKVGVKTLGFGDKWRGGDMNFPGGGQKILLLKKELKSLMKEAGAEEKIALFSDSYDVIFLGELSEIVKRFKSFSNTRVLFSAEPFCWPDVTLAEKYPEVEEGLNRFLNSGGFMGYLPELYEMVKHTPVKNEDDDQLYYTNIYLDKELRERLKISLDHKSLIFQNLNGANVSLHTNDSEHYPYLTNQFDNRPLVLHGNGPSKLTLNGLSNYLAHAWSVTQGCQICKKAQSVLNEQQLPTIMMALFIEYPTPFVEEYFHKISTLNYPKDKIHLLVRNAVEHHDRHVEHFVTHFSKQYASFKQIKHSDDIDEGTSRNLALELTLSKKCDYFFLVDSIAHMDNKDTLRELLKAGFPVVAPLLTRPGKAWSNFWGSLTPEGYYARSDDYMEISQLEKRGVWNVPFINACYLVKSSVLEKYNRKQLTYKSEVDPDMSFCTSLRELGVFMYVLNIQDYGHLIDPETFDITLTNPDVYQIFENKWDWEQRYLNPEYAENFNPNIKPKQPCPDVYWFPVVTMRFCTDYIEIMEAFGKWSDGSNNDKRLEGGYEAVPTRDIHTNQIGYERHWLYILQEYVRPLQELVFTGYYHDPPRSLMNFVVRYRPGEQPSLRPHHDSSTYTINLALNTAGEDYEGGGCHFIRYNCSVKDTRPGWMLMHPGRLTHYHEGLLVTKGTRYIMISFVDP